MSTQGQRRIHFPAAPYWSAGAILLASFDCGFAAAPASDASDSSLALQEIVVTAQKREESAQSVPISMEVFSSQMLVQTNTKDLKDLQLFVPNLLIQTSPGNDEIYLRGFGSASTNYAFEQSVSMYMDGIYGGRNRQFMTPFFDVERIEVLRGPQGALLGKNTAAGAISIVTAGPTRDFQGGATASYDFDRDGEEISAFVSGPLSDRWSGRIAAQYTDLGGWIKNIATGTDDPSTRDKLVRGSLRYDLNDHTNIVARYEYDDLNRFGSANTPISAAVPTPDLPDQKDAAPPFGQRDSDAEISHNASLTANIGLSDLTLTSVTGYSQFDDTNIVGVSNLNPEVFAFTSTEAFDQFSQEIRLLSPTNQKVEYIVGAYYDSGHYSDGWAEQYNLFGGAAAGKNHFLFSQHSITWSAFAQSKWHMTDDLSLLGSVRYTENTKHATFFNIADSGFPLYPNNAVAGAIKDTDVDPSVTLQYQVVPKTMVYATFARGSKGGGFVSNTQEVPQADFAYKPEKSTNYEIGLKSEFFDNRVIADIAVFDTRFSDLQVSVEDTASLTFQTKNAASAASRGVETSFQWIVVGGLRLTSSFAYLDAKYTDFPGAECSSLEPPTCTPATNNLKGQMLPSASKWSGNLGFDYSHPVVGGLRFSVAPYILFRSAYIIDAGDPNPIYGVQGGYAKFDARVSLGSSSDAWKVSVIGKNLSNKRTASVSYVFPFPTPMAETYQDESRSVALQLAVRF
jgi:iron complex outermembrane receptor protein